MDELSRYAMSRRQEITGKDRNHGHRRYALMLLPALAMRDEGGLSNREIARELGVTDVTVARMFAWYEHSPWLPQEYTDEELSQFLRDGYSYSEIHMMTGAELQQISRASRLLDD